MADKRMTSVSEAKGSGASGAGECHKRGVRLFRKSQDGEFIWPLRKSARVGAPMEGRDERPSEGVRPHRLHTNRERSEAA